MLIDHFRKVGLLMLGVLAFAASPAYSLFFSSGTSTIAQCPSGRSSARLTGWMLNNRMPRGSAEFNESSRTLLASIENAALPDGTVLSIWIGDDRVGPMGALKDGAANGTLTRPLNAGDRVRIFHEDRPVVSGDLTCVEAPAARNTTATSTPTPERSVVPPPEQTATPAPSPSPTGTVIPPATPTATPMPSPTLS